MASYKRALPWVVWLLASIFYAYQYILRILPSITIDEIMHKFNIDATVFGQYSGVYYLGYAGMHIPLGIMLDRIGPKKVLPISIVAVVVGLMPMLYSDSWVLACIGRFMIGAGSSAAILGVFKIIRMTFSEERFGRMLGISVTIGLVGAIYGSQPLNYQLAIIGYEHMLHVIMFMGVLLALFIYIMVPAQKEDVILSQSVWADVKNLLKTPNVLMICLLSGLMVGPLDGFADVWGASYLMVSYGFEKSMAASLPSLIFFGMGIGSPLLAVIAEKTGRYYEVIIACAAMMALTFVMLLFGKIQSFTMGTLFFLTGIACAYQILAIYKASTCVSESLVGLTTATVNMVIMAFGYMFHSSIGKVMEAAWDGTIIDGIHVYSAKAYTLGLAIIPIALIIGGVGFALIRIRSRKSLNQNA
ncbi:MAG: MFS transporter [Alphaproteobacteria bacterium]|nr:MFS transporter [Alphaproteobacteria bacterium]OJV45659.1 MAG: hypothetical protein BGO28_02225 [Alphaproteobacteria bacterium 43-37]